MFDQTMKEMLECTNLEDNKDIKPQMMKFTLTFEDISIEYDYTLN